MVAKILATKFGFVPDCSVENCCISSANALGILQFCTEPNRYESSEILLRKKTYSLSQCLYQIHFHMDKCLESRALACKYVMISRWISNIRHAKSQNLNVSSFGLKLSLHIWMINNLIAYWNASYIRLDGTFCSFSQVDYRAKCWSCNMCYQRNPVRFCCSNLNHFEIEEFVQKRCNLIADVLQLHNFCTILLCTVPAI